MGERSILNDKGQSYWQLTFFWGFATGNRPLYAVHSKKIGYIYYPFITEQPNKRLSKHFYAIRSPQVVFIEKQLLQKQHKA
jgi:hypothetical protein